MNQKCDYCTNPATYFTQFQETVDQPKSNGDSFIKLIGEPVTTNYCSDCYDERIIEPAISSIVQEIIKLPTDQRTRLLTYFCKDCRGLATMSVDLVPLCESCNKKREKHYSKDLIKASEIKSILMALEKLTPYERLQVLKPYCHVCGSKECDHEE